MPRLPKYFRIRNGRFYVVKWHGGRVRWKSFGTDRAEAIRLGTMWLQRLATERHVARQPSLLRNVAARWLELSGRRPRSARMATSRLKHMIYPLLGNMNISVIRKPQLLALRAGLTEQGYALETIRCAMGDLRCVLNFAVEAELLAAAPSFQRCLPARVDRLPDRLSDADVDKLLAVARAPWRWAIELSLLTGIRWGELRSLRWDRVVWKPQPMLQLEQTKSGKVRRVPLCQRAVEILTAERFRSRGEYVFPLRGKSPSNSSLRLARKAEARFHWHMLRHTFACRWLEQGGSKEVLQELLGHESITMTERYGKLSDDAVCEAVRRLDAAKLAADSLAESRTECGQRS